MPRFPKNFVWGTATSAYQIEGGIAEGGRGASIWDTFSHRAGTILDGSNGDIAIDHYNLRDEDIDLMAEFGIKAYRFSIAWPRIFPQGVGNINDPGMAFYDKLVDKLLEKDIQPWVTLYHWDLPQALEDRGGWPNRDTVLYFVAYAEAVSKALGDRVKHWITHNEPWVFSYLGYYMGTHAPGEQDLWAAVRATHHALLSHGIAVPVIRSNSVAANVGITLNLAPIYPMTDSPADVMAARHHDGWLNRWFLDPLFRRGYPEDMMHLFGQYKPGIEDGDMAKIGTPIDFLGLNYYSAHYVRAVSSDENMLGFSALGPEDLENFGFELTEMGWPIVPDGMTDILIQVHEEYEPKSIIITENGAAFADAPVNNIVDDPRRVDYLRHHLEAVRVAIKNGVPVDGYFAWSFFDNFEWAEGYTKRFGLVYVDYEDDNKRIPKTSAAWYNRVIEANAIVD
ncbi:MAG: beta-glucosidase [Chloroflexi bacterium]|nr:beta-glucosidase [Chloroflexota bacterium]